MWENSTLFVLIFVSDQEEYSLNLGTLHEDLIVILLPIHSWY
jgi:hypothetical protein